MQYTAMLRSEDGTGLWECHLTGKAIGHGWGKTPDLAVFAALEYAVESRNTSKWRLDGDTRPWQVVATRVLGSWHVTASGVTVCADTIAEGLIAAETKATLYRLA